MKPIIGICANYSKDEKLGLITGLGLPGQEWQLLADDYIKAIERAGGSPIILPITKHIDSLSGILHLLDGILFSGGTDIDPLHYGELPRYGLGLIDPERDAHELQLAKKVLYEMEIPVLGICRGIQVLNVAAGGTLYQDLQRQRPEGFNHTVKEAPKYHPTHIVHIKERSRLHSIFKKDTIGVNSFNHQAICQVGDGFDVTMTAPDGLIEGIEWTGDRFAVAVQWHPEMMIDRYPEYMCLFEEFVNHCKRKG
ncbi:putative glutamine amidotransferase [Caldalkalibacillus uzonensis]|uniref:Glutamine amidotransferase n=1 Tax=Caldalkalibacillus uzonensis TaxID=353224 RepID=A0ABU0CNP1_9BACI|nr:gamma-glutamyl-gamma-aminobutyrate hydrolase family protein [Caldalkalibacillus uzonensis]MDQ0338033.1 putative glutamine amidotransferase [Caldalkalibacillus uzonensis]